MQLVNEDLIKKWEELRLKAYKPTKDDVWTIGWGHTHTTKEGQIINKQMAQVLFDKDTAWAVAAVNKLVKVELNQNQFDSLVSFVFNVGEGAFKKSTLLRKLNLEDYQGAAAEFLRWNKQKDKKTGKMKILKGLSTRRNEEMVLFLDLTDNDHPLTAEGPEPLKPLVLSKEVLGGVGAALTGVGGFLTTLTPVAANTLSLALVGILVGFGLFFIWNRIRARRKGLR